MMAQLCVLCKKYPGFRHPVTGRQFKLCADCGLKAVIKFLNLQDEDFEEIQPIDPIAKEPGVGLMQ